MTTLPGTGGGPHPDGAEAGRLARRYLDVLTGSLLDEHYLENELRLDHLMRTAAKNRPFSIDAIRDPARFMRNELRHLEATRRTGEEPDDGAEAAAHFPYTTMGRVRLQHLQATLDGIRQAGVPGDLVECGTGRGGGGVFLRGYADAYGWTDRTVWVADRFRASAEGGPGADGGGPGFPALLADLNAVRHAFHVFGLLDDQVRFLQGPFADTLPAADVARIALLRIDARRVPSTTEVLEALYPRVVQGGAVVVDGCDDPEVRAELDRFRHVHGAGEPVERMDWAAVVWHKAAPTEVTTTSPAAGQARWTVERTAPHPAPVDGPTKDLSVVVVFYNMKREAARTLHSLSRAYQVGVEDLDYEVLVVENGSAPDQRLGAEYVGSFGPEFRYLDLGEDARPSPVFALNAGIMAATGDVIALMIDGAHVLTPGVLSFAMGALRTHEPAVVAAQQWYVGPGEQNETVVHGYDQAFEDELFERIGWPNDGYRLFDIGTFIGDRDWFDGIWESNCIFVPRSHLEQVGGFDNSFSEAGGGYANLELYERLVGSPDITFVTMLGEGSFHQVHGGTTTNQTDATERRRRITSYAQHFSELRGRPFRGPGKPIHFVGAMRENAARTKPRFRGAPNLFKRGPGTKGVPDEPTPMPVGLRSEFVEAYWNTLSWKDVSWLGRPVGRPPTDLFIYQEMLSEARPDWVVDTGTGNGGRAFFLATICELLGHGKVVSVGKAPKDGERPTHPRLVHIAGEPTSAEVAAEVHQLVGSPGNAMLVLGSRTDRRRTVLEFDTYADLVPTGSFVVVEDTMVNGNPVWPEFGPGPAEGVRAIMQTTDGHFVVEPAFERFGLTFNPAGFLKRVGPEPPPTRSVPTRRVIPKLARVGSGALAYARQKTSGTSPAG
jgi:cephalosporin hydroxylase